MRRLVLVACLLLSRILSSQDQASDLRAQLVAIDYRHARDLNDYVSRCKQIEALLPRLRSFYDDANAAIERLRSKHRSDPHFIEVADVYISLNRQDRAGVKLLRQEVTLASRMSLLPTENRQSFFDREISPIRAKEDQLSEDEIRMAIRAKKNGIPPPSDIGGSLSNSK